MDERGRRRARARASACSAPAPPTSSRASTARRTRCAPAATPPRRAGAQEPPEAWGVLQAGDERRRVRTEPGAYRRFYAELRDALTGTAPLPVDPADAVAALALLEEAAAS